MLIMLIFCLEGPDFSPGINIININIINISRVLATFSNHELT